MTHQDVAGQTDVRCWLMCIPQKSSTRAHCTNYHELLLIHSRALSSAVKVADCAAYELFREQQPEAPKHPCITLHPFRTGFRHVDKLWYSHYLPWVWSISGCNHQLLWRYNRHIWHVDRLRLLLVLSLASLSGSLLRWWLRASCPMIKVLQSWRPWQDSQSVTRILWSVYCMTLHGKHWQIMSECNVNAAWNQQRGKASSVSERKTMEKL